MFYDLLIFIFMSYIKPQLSAEPSALLVVVYRTIPTSNHNLWLAIHFTLMLYIILFLHQTTTVIFISSGLKSCISYYSYIKPQLADKAHESAVGCISYYSYIKPQLTRDSALLEAVVYRTIPTSNHNFFLKRTR